MTRGLLLAVLLLIAAPAYAGAVYNATSCSSTHVQDQLTLVANAADNPSDPPTVNIPAGNCTWATQVSLASRSVILKGAGDSTVICDNYTTDILRISPAIGDKVRVSSMKFTACGGSGDQPLIRIVGPSGSSPPQVRLDRLTFTSVNRGYKIYALDVVGVADQGTCDETGIFKQCFSVQHSQWAGSAQAHGSWSAATNLGSADAFYIENWTYTLGGTGSFLADGEAGGRIVNRKNTLNDSQMGIHGTETGDANTRGPRYQEVYSNTLNLSSSWTGSSITWRGGTGVAFNNTNVYGGSNGGPYVALTLNRNRTSNMNTWGGCDGTGPYDNNTGTIYYASSTLGTAISGSGYLTLKVAGTPFPDLSPTSSIVYSVRNLTQAWANGFQYSGYISSNTSDTLTMLASGGFGDPTFSIGDAWEIRSASVCLDQPGRGQSDTLTPGSPPLPQSWVHNALEPIYIFNNTGSAWTFGEAQMGQQNARLVIERDYYTTVSSFNPNAVVPTCNTNAPIGNGTCGVGVGPIASRPATCTTGTESGGGVGYWATDEGEWDSTHAGADGRLYKCTATNTWTLYYTPYTYPHPLRSITTSVLGDPLPPVPAVGRLGNTFPKR